MIAKNEKGVRIGRVLVPLLFFSINVATGQELGKNATSMTENDATAGKLAAEVAVSSILGREKKLAARSEEEVSDLIEPSTRSVEWKNSGPLTRTKDSYLEALRHSRTSTDPREGIVAVDGAIGSGSFQRRKEQPQGPVYAAKRSELSFGSSRVVGTEPDRDSFSMVPSDSYSLPIRSSGDFGTSGPRISYGSPQLPQSVQSQPPRESYGPPRFNDYHPYGEYGSGGAYSSPQQAYGSPAYGTAVPYGYGLPHGTGMSESVQLGFPSIDFSWPFALKLNAFTLAKILLKLVIFKMIVKFIAVICLLLFIPKLEIKKGNKGNMGSANDDDDDDDENEGRRLLDANSKVWDRLNLLTLVVNDALRLHANPNEPRSNSIDDCSTLECRVRRALERDQSWPDYEQLLQNYLLEETRFVQAKS